jgi:hypothetical protein
MGKYTAKEADDFRQFSGGNEALRRTQKTISGSRNSFSEDR